MNKKHLSECLQRLNDARDALDQTGTDLRGAQEFRDAVYDLLEDTPFGAQADSQYDGLYGRLRAAIQSAAASPSDDGARQLQEPFGSMDRLIAMARCQHVNRGGGNDYIECADCGLMWDYRKESPSDGLVNYIKLLPLTASDRPACSGCGGPHPFDTTVPSVRWNAVIRKAGLPDYLCLTCIVSAFVKAGESFTAELIGGEHNFEPIEIRTRGQNAIDAQALSAENTELRATLAAASDGAARPQDDALLKLDHAICHLDRAGHGYHKPYPNRTYVPLDDVLMLVRELRAAVSGEASVSLKHLRDVRDALWNKSRSPEPHEEREYDLSHRVNDAIRTIERIASAPSASTAEGVPHGG